MSFTHTNNFLCTRKMFLESSQCDETWNIRYFISWVFIATTQSLLFRVNFSPEFLLKKHELGFVGVAEVELMDRRWSWGTAGGADGPQADDVTFKFTPEKVKLK